MYTLLFGYVFALKQLFLWLLMAN